MVNDITVIIPHLREREMMLDRAIGSVMIQTYPAFCTLTENAQPGENAATVRNRALNRVFTEWIAWLDDDDQFLPNHLEVCINAARETGADLVYPGMEIIGRDDPLAVSVDGKWVNPFGVPFGPEQEAHIRGPGNFIPITYLVKTELVKRVGGFPQPFSDEWSGRCEDHGLLIRLLDAGAKFHHAPVRTWRYYIHGENTGGLPKEIS